MIKLDLWSFDGMIAITLFVVSFTIFVIAPVRQVTDSNYSVLLSESLLHHRTFSLDPYNIPRFAPRFHDNTYKDGPLYQIEYVGNRLYYYFPPGSSVLSMPFVEVLNLFGISAARADGTYDIDGEIRIESLIAALLMSILIVCFYILARSYLSSPTSSILIAVAAGFSTPIFSAASRALWGDTWATLLIGLILVLLVATAHQRLNFHPELIATLLAWSYFVRPVSAIAILAITIYCLVLYSRTILRFLVTGLVWLLLFTGWSFWNFHSLIPRYFMPGRLVFRQFAEAVAGNLVSPSRGLLVFVPILLVVLYMLIKRWRQIPDKPLAYAAIAVIIGHIVVVSGFDPWNGGACYGPRYMIPLVPWFVVLAVIAFSVGTRDESIKADSNRRLPGHVKYAVVVILLAIGFFLNARGAVSHETWQWIPVDAEAQAFDQRIWNWRYPQFMAGLINPPLPEKFPAVNSTISLNTREAEDFLWYGWSGLDQQGRWTDGHQAALIFSTAEKQIDEIEITARPFVANKLTAQRCEIILNDHSIARINWKNNEFEVIRVAIPTGIIAVRNRLVLNLPDAESPQSSGTGNDNRVLGLFVQSISFDRQ